MLHVRNAALILLVTIAAGSTLSARQAGYLVTGSAIDSSGAVLPGAQVTISSANGVTVATTTADGSGGFQFGNIAPGRYDVQVSYEGFEPATAHVTVGNRAPSPVRVVLSLAGVKQQVTVTNRATEVNSGAGSNSDAVTVDASFLEQLPMLDQDLIATMSRFLDPGALGNGGVTVVVNGMEVSALRVSASAVQQIKINQDPYSAEYARPGRGRIEILTKPGSQQYHGEFNALGRNAIFDAKNAFATTKPADRRRIVEGSYGGPIGHNAKTSFMFSGHDETDDQQAFIFAAGPEGTIQGTAKQPSRESLIAGSITRQKSDATTISVRGSYNYESDQNRGVGGTTLATAGSNFEHNEQQVTYTQQTMLAPTLLLQFQILFGHETEPTVSVTPLRGIVVSGAFRGGGAQADLLRTETHTQSTASIAWTKGHNLVQAGFQLPDWSRRGFYDQTNAAGTFYFANLAAYEIGQPYSFIQQRGNGDLAFLEKQVGAYVKDDWQVNTALTLSTGLRYDWQNYFHDTNNFAPRASVAFAPGKRRRDVFRGGVGIFNDRSGPVAIADLLHSQPGGLVRYVISDPSYPDPFAGTSAAAEPPSIVQLAPDVRIPQTLQYSVGLDHQLAKATTMSVTYTGAHGFHLFRSRDINAPPPPAYDERPDPAYAVIRQIESTGRQQSDSLSVTVRGRFSKNFTGQAQYGWSRGWNDTNGIDWYAANDYDLTGEYARADFDRRHRLTLIGSTHVGKIADVGVGLTANSAGPVHRAAGSGRVQQRPRTRAACRRGAQHPRSRGLCVTRHSRLAQLHALEGRLRRAHGRRRHRRVQHHESSELRRLRGHDQLSALLGAHQRTPRTSAAVFGPVPAVEIHRLSTD